ncbi:MAG: calcium-binding protein, partial [Methylovulum sp.]
NALDNDLMGNNVANNMAGFDGDDTLYGFGGNDALFGVNGVDTMFGGAGDYYEVDNINDITVEWSNDGNDEVHSTVSYVLSDNVERLTADGAANISVTGNSLGNGLWGNSGNNIMIGLTGNDYLVGNRQ